MSAEHITNQSHLNKFRQEDMAQLHAKEITKEFKARMEQRGVPKIDPDESINASNIQQLLSQQSEKAKQEITKKSLENMQDKGQIHNEELEEEINRELNKFFEPKTSTKDKATLSKEYQEKLNDLKEKKESTKDNKTLEKFAALTKKQQDQKIKKDTLNLALPSTDEALLKPKAKPSQAKEVQEKTPQLLHQKDLKEFSKLISKYALNQDPNTKQAIEKKKQHLSQRGLSTFEINFMANKVGQVIKQHMVYDLKQKLINFHMSKGFSKQEHIQNTLSFNASSKVIENLKESGRLPADISQTVDHLRHQAKQDLGNFLYEESVNQFTKHSLGQISIEKFTEELVRLQKAAQSAGVTISEDELTEKIYAAIDHLGLGEFTRPNTDSKNKQKQPERIISQEEALDDKLRYLYLMKALHPSLQNKIDIHFKMKKCRNGMIKLGFYTEEKENNLKRQAEFLAANQFKEELEFIFREEATLPKLTGSEYGVLRKKKAFFLGQLRKVNHGLNTSEIERMQENMYREMYGLMKEELLQLKEMAEIHKHVSLTRKVKHLQEVIKRIRESVPVNDYKSNISNLMVPLKHSQVNEGA